MNHITHEDSLIQQALNGERGIEQTKIAKAGIRILETVLRKNKDYGSSALLPPVLLPSIGTRASILIRMSDKIGRLSQLLQAPPEVIDESIADTVDDLIGYSLLLQVAMGREENNEQ